MFWFRGSRALTEFKSKKLLLELQQLVPSVRALGSEFVHLVDSTQALNAVEQATLPAPA